MDKLKVVWLCNFSCQEIRDCIKLRTSFLEPFMMKIVKRSFEKNLDCGIWNVNAIEEIKHIHQIELHVIMPIRNLASKRQDFMLDGIEYHFFRDENSPLYRKIIRFLFTKYSSRFKKNRKYICKIVSEVKPDLIHIIGAENPQYSLALLDLSKDTPTILQLQALLASIVDKTTGERKKEYQYKAKIEKELICSADYIGTRVPSFVEYIRNEVKKDAKIVNLTLAMAQKIDNSEIEKKYDFVHFAANLGESKATDIAIAAFGEAYKKHPELTLDIIGYIPDDFKEKVEQQILQLGIKESVFFEGRLPTHDDVINQVRKSRFALLPLKVSVVPNTLRESMANGIPVITTVTSGTPKLNEKRRCVLISPQDDIIDLADKIVLLVEDESLQNELRNNALIEERERENNSDIINHWVELYKAIVLKENKGIEIPKAFFIE